MTFKTIEMMQNTSAYSFVNYLKDKAVNNFKHNGLAATCKKCIAWGALLLLSPLFLLSLLFMTTVLLHHFFYTELTF